MKTMNCVSSEMVYIGDEIRDIIACKKTNLKVIGISWGYDSLKALPNEVPDFLVEQPLDILQLPIFDQ